MMTIRCADDAASVLEKHASSSFFKTYWPDTFGGIERTIHAIAKGVAEHGIASDVLSLSAKPEENTRKF